MPLSCPYVRPGVSTDSADSSVSDDVVVVDGFCVVVVVVLVVDDSLVVLDPGVGGVSTVTSSGSSTESGDRVGVVVGSVTSPEFGVLLWLGSR